MYKVIDIFAGPGGLSEGFASSIDIDGEPVFDVSLSIEKDNSAYETLKLRAFYRQFRKNPPSEYYELLKGNISQTDLYSRYPYEAAEASKRSWRVALGPGGATISEIRVKVFDALGKDNNFVLIGGPPCQAYSLVGRSRNAGNPNYDPEKDERQRLYIEYLQFLADFGPSVFVMENVKGLLSARLREQNIFKKILSDLRHPKEALSKEGRNVLERAPANYNIFSLRDGKIINEENPRDAVIEAERYGIPQARHRVFLLGIRADLGEISPTPLVRQEEIPIEMVISDLPPLRSGLSEGHDSPSLWENTLHSQLTSSWVNFPQNSLDSDELHRFIEINLKKIAAPPANTGKEYLDSDLHPSYNEDWYHDCKLPGVCNHSSRSHLETDLYRYFFAACYAKLYGISPKLKDFPRVLLPDHSNVEKAIIGNNNFSDRFRVQLLNKPSKTIVSHISKDGHYYIHPDPLQCRSFTVREAARIQTFPDNYYFCGPRTSQYIQVGNAVPPLLARQIAEIVSKVLEHVNGITVENR